MSSKFQCSLIYSTIKTPVKVYSANEQEGCHIFSREGIFEYVAAILLTKEKEGKGSSFTKTTSCPLCRRNIFLLKIDNQTIEEMANSSSRSNSPRGEVVLFTKDENTKKLFYKFIEVFNAKQQITIEEMNEIRDKFIKEEFVPYDNNIDPNTNRKMILYLTFIIVTAFVIYFANFAIYQLFFHSTNSGIARNRIARIIPHIGTFRNFRFHQ